MKDANWKSIAELIGIAAIVASLYFLGVQLKLSQDIAQSEITASQHASFVELNNALNDHADVWIRGNAGRDLDQVEMAIYRRLLRGTYNQYRIEWRHKTRFWQEVDLLDESVHFAGFLHDNPGAKKVWLAYQDDNLASVRRIRPDLEAHRFNRLVRADLKKYEELQN